MSDANVKDTWVTYDVVDGYYEQSVNGQDSIMRKLEREANDASGYKGIDKFISDLGNYSNRAFQVGDSNTFDIATKDYVDAVGKLNTKVESYLADAMTQREYIEWCMLTDAMAKAAAEKAYAAVMADVAAYTETYTDDSGVTHKTYHYTKQLADARAKKDEVWRAENCPLWDD